MFLSYLLSFVNVGIYWNNHHHMLQATEKVNGLVLWANLHLLFWLSLVPFVTGWMGENHFAAVPTALYGVVLLHGGLRLPVPAARHPVDGGAALDAGARRRAGPQRSGLANHVRRRDSRGVRPPVDRVGALHPAWP